MGPLAIAYYVFLVIAVMTIASSAIAGIATLSIMPIVFGVISAAPAMLFAWLLRDHKSDN